MNKYTTACRKQMELFSMYHSWYKEEMSSGRLQTFRRFFKTWPRILKAVRREQDIKKVVYREIKRLTVLKRLAWCRYQNHLRFNFFCIAVYRQTRVDVSFARNNILECLHGPP